MLSEVFSEKATLQATFVDPGSSGWPRKLWCLPSPGLAEFLNIPAVRWKIKHFCPVVHMDEHLSISVLWWTLLFGEPSIHLAFSGNKASVLWTTVVFHFQPLGFRWIWLCSLVPKWSCQSPSPGLLLALLRRVFILQGGSMRNWVHLYLCREFKNEVWPGSVESWGKVQEPSGSSSWTVTHLGLADKDPRRRESCRGRCLVGQRVSKVYWDKKNKMWLSGQFHTIKWWRQSGKRECGGRRGQYGFYYKGPLKKFHRRGFSIRSQWPDLPFWRSLWIQVERNASYIGTKAEGGNSALRKPLRRRTG